MRVREWVLLMMVGVLLLASVSDASARSDDRRSKLQELTQKYVNSYRALLMARAADDPSVNAKRKEFRQAFAEYLAELKKFKLDAKDPSYTLFAEQYIAKMAAEGAVPADLKSQLAAYVADTKSDPKTRDRLMKALREWDPARMAKAYSSFRAKEAVARSEFRVGRDPADMRSPTNMAVQDKDDDQDDCESSESQSQTQNTTTTNQQGDDDDYGDDDGPRAGNCHALGRGRGRP